MKCSIRKGECGLDPVTGRVWEYTTATAKGLHFILRRDGATRALPTIPNVYSKALRARDLPSSYLDKGDRMVYPREGKAHAPNIQPLPQRLVLIKLVS